MNVFQSSSADDQRFHSSSSSRSTSFSSSSFVPAALMPFSLSALALEWFSESVGSALSRAGRVVSEQRHQQGDRGGL